MQTTVRLDPDRVPAALRKRRQWVVWRVEDTPRGPTKVPHRAERPSLRASTRQSGHWSDFDMACRALAQTEGLAGVGFVLTADDPFVGIDLDDVIDPETRAVHPLAARAIRKLDTYTETSPSGTGVHLILEGSLEALRGRKHGRVEIYDEGRYLTVTGRVLGGHDTIRPRQDALAAFHAFAFPGRRGRPPGHPRGKAEAGADDAAAAGQEGGLRGADDLSDYELLERMFASRHGEEIAALYEGDTGDHPSHSEADLALASHLAWWTGYDRERADRLFRGSGLYRDKWDERHYGDGRTYGEGTLDTAFDRT